MSVRRGNSDSKLTQMIKHRYDEDSLDNFLPKFLIKDMNTKDELKNINDHPEIEKKRSIFDTKEQDDMNDYLKNLSIKEVYIILIYRILIH
jgi:hypothetical protein